MMVKLMRDESLDRLPEIARPQIALVLRRQCDFSPAFHRSNLVRATQRCNAAFDPEALLNHVELQ
jgi:hypothetical protein